jgi:predicted nucleic acid binding AN1-type Zn finger protein
MKNMVNTKSKSNTKTKSNTKCYLCKKKIALAMRGIPCQCGHEFCILHRLPESHNCDFNNREHHLQNREEKINSMKCESIKINKI